MKVFPSPLQMIYNAGESLIGPRASIISPEKWQGVDITQPMLEVFDISFRCIIPPVMEQLAIMSGADLPWAEDHFQERISGNPTNPGDTFRDWPYYKENPEMRQEVFTHTYQERFWPKRANGGQKTLTHTWDRHGIRYDYGDYMDVVNHLVLNPSTRQAFLPVWFPEDTGVVHGGRVPCTIGYLFSYREGYLHMTYYIRSCDYIRHFKNDVYMACRLLQHTLDLLMKTTGPIDWARVRPGRLTFHVQSLHIFESDKLELKKRLK